VRHASSYVRRTYRNGRLKCPKTDGSLRAAPLQAVALEAIDGLSLGPGSALVFPAPCGGYLDLHNFRHRDWKPTQRTLGIDPIRRVYDLATPSPRSRFVPASPPSTSPATWAPA
jgi:hypothetical protein